MKQINEYTVDELSAKIEAIKAERERTANALKRYEEELERREQEVPLGVSLEDMALAAVFDTYKFGFTSENSRFCFSVRLNDYVKFLQKLAKGKPISIDILLPLLKKGWVAMDKNGNWFWYKNKPGVLKDNWMKDDWYFYKLPMFNLKPAENWKDSLMECGI